MVLSLPEVIMTNGQYPSGVVDINGMRQNEVITSRNQCVKILYAATVWP
jgi:hypothetical protein